MGYSRSHHFNTTARTGRAFAFTNRGRTGTTGYMHVNTAGQTCLECVDYTERWGSTPEKKLGRGLPDSSYLSRWQGARQLHKAVPWSPRWLGGADAPVVIKIVLELPGSIVPDEDGSTHNLARARPMALCPTTWVTNRRVYELQLRWGCRDLGLPYWTPSSLMTLQSSPTLLTTG